LPISSGTLTAEERRQSIVGMAQTLRNGQLASWSQAGLMLRLNKLLNRKGIIRNKDLENPEFCIEVEKAILTLCWERITKC
jgi:hypothetical protein